MMLWDVIQGHTALPPDGETGIKSDLTSRRLTHNEEILGRSAKPTVSDDSINPLEHVLY